MTEADTTEQTPTKKPPAKDRRVKMIMLAVIVAVAGAIYVSQLRPRTLPKIFSTDLDATLAQAQREKRTVLVVFWAKPMNEATRFVFGAKGLRNPQVRKAVKKGRHLCAAAKVNRELTSPLAKRYGVKALPSMMVLSPDGKPLARRTGRVGHAELSAMLEEATKAGEPAP
ncbi:hypothetical protein LCGC14_2538080 [marine sediment metagenome]|uniref:Thioredoxin domain-containing protein n=1 Tax=marine sediment metagenome TaxID=412755 RepID=A0A0F9ARM7_9ZZZZ